MKRKMRHKDKTEQEKMLNNERNGYECQFEPRHSKNCKN